MKKLFVGGMASSGSRVTQWILNRLGGYYLGDNINEFADWMGFDTSFINCFNTGYFYNNWELLHQLIDKCVQGHNSWSLKHGYLMFCIPQLKEWYPDSKFILTVRHPIDNMLKPNRMHISYQDWDQEIKNPNLSPPYKYDKDMQSRLNYYGNVLINALQNTDYVSKLEDICYTSEITIQQLCDFAEIKYNDSYTSWLIKPSTIGRGKEYYDQLNHPIIQKLGY